MSESCKEKTDSFFNIRQVGNVFLHSSVCLCVCFSAAISFTAVGIAQLLTKHHNHNRQVTESCFKVYSDQ